MPESTHTKPGPDSHGHPRQSSRYASFADLQKLEVKATVAAVHKLRQGERRKALLSQLVGLWPVAAGLVLAAFAPLLRDAVSQFGTWAMWVAFPFAVLAGRPEIYVDDRISHWLPLVMLYAQFPIEGLLAKIALKPRVTFAGVTGQILFFHFLGVAELWLVSGEMGQMLTR